MRRLATALLLTASLVPAGARADDFTWPGRGTIRMAVPAGWSVLSKDAGDVGYAFHAQPKAGPPIVAQITLAALPPDKPMRADDVKASLERSVQPYLSGSVEKSFAPEPLPVSHGSGWVVQLTDASLVGKSPESGNFKVMRIAVAAAGDQLMMIATIQFNDPSRPEVAEAMSLISSLRLDRSSGAPPAVPASGVFEFTIPESRVTVKVPDMGLRQDRHAGGEPRYFKLSRSTPQLIVSGWLEPASRYKGLKAFWESETRSPAYAGAGAPTRVEMLQVGPWEVVAFDVVVPGGTSAHLRAERVQTGTWIDLHLSSTSARTPTALREELIAALRKIEVVDK